MGKTIDTDKQRRILDLRARGISYSKIAAEVGVAKQTAIDLCKAQEEAVATLRAIYLEELYEQHRITKEERIAAHASLLERIRTAIQNRDLSDVPTEKLIDLELKLSAALNDEIVEPNFQTSEEQERDRKERRIINEISSL